MEVDGKLFTEKEETTITMDAYGKKTTMIEVTRTIAVGEKICTVIFIGYKMVWYEVNWFSLIFEQI